MRRTTRRAAWVMVLLTAGAMSQLTLAPAASAQTTCRSYGSFPTDTGARVPNARICAAPASDFPQHEGWGRVVDTYSTASRPCGFSLFPHEHPLAIMCMAVMPPPVPAWKRIGDSWVPLANNSLYPGSRAYLWPYTAGWRYAWTERTGLVAIQEKHAAFRWYAS